MTSLSPAVRRRSKAEIWSQIIEQCTKIQRTQTWLLRNLGLKTETIKDALTFLLHAQLIQTNQHQDQDTVTYTATLKGEEALAQYYLLITKYYTSQEK